MLIPIKYHSKSYPHHIKPEIDEVAGHFDVNKISVSRKFSLHTEYSYGARKLNSELLKNFQLIRESNKKGVPQLWFSVEWAIEFAKFIKSLCKKHSPQIIEIHPPFTDYAKSIDHLENI
jgi:hypothetical protein